MEKFIGVRIHRPVMEGLDELATGMGVTRSDVVRMALERMLRDIGNKSDEITLLLNRGRDALGLKGRSRTIMDGFLSRYILAAISGEVDVPGMLRDLELDPEDNMLEGSRINQ